MLQFWRRQSHAGQVGSKSSRRTRALRFESLDSRRVLAAAFQNPGQIFDVNNDTYVDQEDVRLSEVRLNTVGEGALPTTRNHHLIPFYDVNGDGSFSKQDITLLRNQIQRGTAITSVKLANDSGNKLDQTTNDVRIIGRVMGFDSRTKVYAWFEGGDRARVEITSLIGGNGAFELSIHDLHRINGRIFADGEQKFLIQSYDRFGRTNGVVDYSFTIDRTGPTAFNLDARVFESPVGKNPSTWVARWIQNDARSYDLKITYDAAGENVMFSKRDLTRQDSTRYVIGSPTSGTYYVWVTGFDASGNRTEATGSGQRVDWHVTFNPDPVPTMEPARFGTNTANGVTTQTWRVNWTNHASDVQSSKLLVTRDRAGTDVAFEGITSASLTHLEKGTYYVFITEFRASGAVNICDGVEVVWNPTRPDDFSTDPPGFGIGDSIQLNWQQANTAVRYKVELFRTDLFLPFHLNALTPPGGDPYDRGPDLITAGSFDSTTNSLLVSHLDEGLYAVKVTAFDADGNRTIARELQYFTIDADGNIVTNGLTAYRQGTDKIYISAYPATTSSFGNGSQYFAMIGGVNGIDTTRFEIYSDASLSQASLLRTFSSDQTNLTLQLAPYLSYAKLFVKVAYFDRLGNRLNVTNTLEIEPSKLQPMFSILH